MATTTLPIINIASYLQNDPLEQKAMAAALHSACVEWGFFYLDISSFLDYPSQAEDLADLARQFFALSQEEKDKLSLRNQDHARGLDACCPL